MNGGTYTPDLSRNCTHMVANSSGKSGVKWSYAVKWNVKIVSMNWIDDCIKLNRILPETEYLLEPITLEAPLTQTPVESNNASLLFDYMYFFLSTELPSSIVNILRFAERKSIVKIDVGVSFSFRSWFEGVKKVLSR